MVLLIGFDAAQQYYYLTRFNLIPENTSLSLLELMLSHLWRWCIWLLVSTPFFFLVHRTFTKSPEKNLLDFPFLLVLLVSHLCSLLLVSFHSLATQEVDLNFAVFFEFFQFFFYQKGLTFLLALAGSYLLIASYVKEKSMQAQLIEIRELKRTNSELKEQAATSKVPHLQIKIGYSLKSVPIDEIIWIQSDDYCVKVHTEEHSFTLRQRLKVLEKKLAAYGFIRIHRSALLNLHYIDQINYRASTIRLKNKSLVPLSKTGIKRLKHELIEQ